MKFTSLLPAAATACVAVAATADVTGVYTTRYTDTSADQGQSTQTTTVIDVYLSSDDDADTVLGVFNFNLPPEAQVDYFQAFSEDPLPVQTWWLAKNLDGIFDFDSTRRSDSFVTIGGFEQNVLRPEQVPGVNAGGRLDQFNNPFDFLVQYPQANAGWWNTTPEDLAGQVGPVATPGPDGEPSGFGRGVFVGRFSYYGDDFSIEDTTLTVAWNQGPGTPQQEADFTIPPVVTPIDCTGDITGDGVVDSGDLGILISLWNTSAKRNPEADINGDGIVNAADIGLLIGVWGACP